MPSKYFYLSGICFTVSILLVLFSFNICFEYQVIALVLSVVNELHQYHKTVAECIAPIVEYSAYRKRNHSKYEMKECSSVPVTWKAVNEVIICNFCKEIVFGLKDSILFCCASI